MQQQSAPATENEQAFFEIIETGMTARN